MLHPPRNSLLLLATISFPLLSILAIGVFSNARELRPSDHGLAYQSSSETTGQDSPELASFFGGSSSSPPHLPLPLVNNISDPSWGWASGSGGGRDHVRDVLVVASLVCGVTGGVVLLAAALLFVFQLRKKKPASASTADKLER